MIIGVKSSWVKMNLDAYGQIMEGDLASLIVLVNCLQSSYAGPRNHRFLVRSSPESSSVPMDREANSANDSVGRDE
jgi:hypothetical protein